MTLTAAADISTRSIPRSATSPQVGSGDGETIGTLAVFPLNRRQSAKHVGWLLVWQRLGMLAQLPPGWNGGGAAEFDQHTIGFAARQLAGLARAGFSAPVINPSADGAVYAHWHALGLDVELVFEAPYQVVTLIEDARGEVTSFAGEDRELRHAIEALEVLAGR